MSYFDFDSIDNTNSRLRPVLQLGKQVAMSQAYVVISGAKGVGKSSMAHYLARKSRANQITTFECQFQKSQELDTVTGGALILEDLDLADMQLQAEILQKLDHLAARRVRIFSTTSQDIRALVKTGKFRSDLYYRLSVIHLEMPSLTDFGDEFKEIVKFVCEVTRIIYNLSGIKVTEAAMDRLENWTWPHNIRELENVIERAVAVSDRGVILPQHIVFTTPGASEQSDSVLAGMTLSEVERKLILQTLQLTAQNRTKAAQILGISIRTLRNKLNEYRLEEVSL